MGWFDALRRWWSPLPNAPWATHPRWVEVWEGTGLADRAAVARLMAHAWPPEGPWLSAERYGPVLFLAVGQADRVVFERAGAFEVAAGKASFEALASRAAPVIDLRALVALWQRFSARPVLLERAQVDALLKRDRYFSGADPALATLWRPPRREAGEAVFQVDFGGHEGIVEIHVGATVRTARLCDSSRQLEPLPPPIPGRPLLDAGGRPCVAGEAPDPSGPWYTQGPYEHASAASFARASLQLMALGAPIDLVARYHLAALDELRHARTCFALAGQPEPGPLEIPALEDLSLPELARRVLLEACVNEGRAADRAAQELAAEPPDRRPLLEALIHEERAHAELAWDTLAWALSEGGEGVRAVLLAADGQLTREESARLSALVRRSLPAAPRVWRTAG